MRKRWEGEEAQEGREGGGGGALHALCGDVSIKRWESEGYTDKKGRREGKEGRKK